jgi:hypothetical protein
VLRLGVPVGRNGAGARENAWQNSFWKALTTNLNPDFSAFGAPRVARD